MSVIAVYVTDETIFLGADTQTTLGSRNKILDSYYGKLFEVNGSYFGGVGASLEIQFFRRFLEGRTLRQGFTELDFNDLMLDFYDDFRSKTKNDSGAIQGNYILVHDGKAFLFADWLIKEVTQFESIGSGCETARTAFEVFRSLGREPDLRTVLEVACKIDLYCHEPLRIYEIAKTPPKKAPRSRKSQA
jgi:ATP-dependent protease HslVU (ClpYQ) peptidase subunit